MPDRDLALKLWNERRADGAWKWTADQIAMRTGYSYGDCVEQLLRRLRREGHPLATRRGYQADKLHRIAAMLRQGLTHAVIAERLGISLENVSKQAFTARARGLAPLVNKPWTPEEDARLIASVAAGEPWKTTSKRLIRSMDACRSRHRALAAQQRGKAA